MSIMDKTLETLKNSGEIAIFITDNMPDSVAHWGVLVDYNTEYIYLSLVAMDGEPGGVIIFLRDDLTRIRWATPKIDSVQTLFDRKENKLCMPEVNITDMQAVLKSIQHAFGYIGLDIERLDDDALLLGEMKELDRSHVIISEFANKEDAAKGICSQCIVALDDITSVVAGDTYHEDILYLNKGADNKL